MVFGQIAVARLIEQMRQVFPAPATTRAGAVALAQLAGTARLFNPQPVDHLTLADVKTEAEFVVEVHKVIVGCRESRDESPEARS